MNNIESNKGEIVMYQPDEALHLEVRVEDETVWLTQQPHDRNSSAIPIII